MLPPDAPDPSIQHEPGGNGPGHGTQAHAPDPAATPLPVVAATAATATPRRLSVLTISIVLVTLLAGSVLFLSGYSVGRQAAVEPGTPVSAADAFRPFWDTYDAINDRYAGGDVDRATIVQGAIRGMIDALGDPYSSYLTSEQYRDSLLGISGQFEGVGAEIATLALDGTEGCAPLGTDCRLIVTRPLDGSPAEKAGVEPGDIVVSVDGTTLDGLTLDAAIERIRGPKGSVVTLTILRGTAAPIDIAITRDIVQSNEVDTKALANGTVGYIRLAGFSDAGADQVVTALNDHLAAGRTKLILDLRGNLGGYVTAARKIASQFIGSGVVFWEQDAAGNQVPTNAARRRRRHRSIDPTGRPHRRQQRVRERDRGRRAPGFEAGAARRPAVVWQGDRPAMAGADRRGRGVQAHDRALADPGQALDPPGRADAGRGRDAAGRDPRGNGPDARPGARGAGRAARGGRGAAARRLGSPRGLRHGPFGSTGAVPTWPGPIRRSCARFVHRVRFPGTKGGDVQ